MTDESLPEMPSLDEVLKKLDDKYAQRESVESHSKPVVVYPITLNCSIKARYSGSKSEGAGEIQVIPGYAVICEKLRVHNEGKKNETHFCEFLYEEECPFYKAYVGKK